MEEITIKISLSKLIELALAEQRLGIKKHLISTLGQPAGDILDKYQYTGESILTVIKSLTDTKQD